MSEDESIRIARQLTRGQWLVLLGPRKFGSHGGAEAHAIRELGLVRFGRVEWPLTPLGKAVIAARPAMTRSDLGERAKRAFDRNANRRETAPVHELAKMLDPWDEAIAAVFEELLQMARAEARTTPERVAEDSSEVKP